MPSKQDNIDFVSKQKFYSESNITNTLVTNIFNITFNFSNSDKDVVDNRLLLELLLDTKSKTLNNLEFNVASIRMPSISNQYDTTYFNNDRLYTHYNDSSDILTLGFYESANIDIRRFFKTWIELTKVDQSTILNNDTGRPYNLYPSQYDCKELILYPLGGNLTSTFAEIYKRIHPISISDITLDNTADASLPIVQVSFVYKSFYNNY